MRSAERRQVVYWAALALTILLLGTLLVASRVFAGANHESVRLSVASQGAGSAENLNCPASVDLVVSANAIAGFTGLHAVDAKASDNVWAVGSGPDATLVEHWNGTAWQVASDAGPGILLDVATLSATDIWAVGERDGAALTAHWDGASWSTVSNPGLDALDSISAISADDIWTVGGGARNAEQKGANGTLIMHWNCYHSSST